MPPLYTAPIGLGPGTEGGLYTKDIENRKTMKKRTRGRKLQSTSQAQLEQVTDSQRNKITKSNVLHCDTVVLHYLHIVLCVGT